MLGFLLDRLRNNSFHLEIWSQMPSLVAASVYIFIHVYIHFCIPTMPPLTLLSHLLLILVYHDGFYIYFKLS